jgi:SAM-dependent methyltransferase
MSKRRSDLEWERFGREDPYFGVLTDERFRQGSLDDQARADFFRSGQDHVDHVFAQIDRHVVPSPTFSRALDFGCGVGRVLVPLARRVDHVTGVDVSESMLGEARSNCAAHGVPDVALFTSDEMSRLRPGTFDFVHTFIVLQHIPPDRGLVIVRRLVELLAADGVAMIHFTYDKGYPVKRVKSFLADHVPYVENLVSAVHGRGFRPPMMHMNSYDPRAVFRILQDANVDDVHVELTDHDGELGMALTFRKGR